MATTLQRTSIRTPLSVEMIAGIWLIISPFILPNINNQALWSFIISGAVVLAAAIMQRRGADTGWPTWVSLIVGIWLLIAPLIVYYSSTATWNGLILGIIIVGMSLWAMMEIGDRYDDRDL